MSCQDYNFLIFSPAITTKRKSGEREENKVREEGKGSVQFSSVQSLSRVQFFATPWITACQASLSITNSWRLPKLMSIESVMPSNHLTLCRPFLLLPSIFPSIRVFSSESILHIRWPKYWSFKVVGEYYYCWLLQRIQLSVKWVMVRKYIFNEEGCAEEDVPVSHWKLALLPSFCGKG